ncbi:MAG: hypothetical protein HRT35_09960 [Algicola sp.]|nr:hypothetical protein [Algicola sp.]
MSQLKNQFIGIFVIRQAILVLFIVICVGVAFNIILWAKKPDMRPLLDDMREAQAAKIVDVLEQQGIRYKVDMDNHKLYVVEERSIEARLALSRVGIIIEYPPYWGAVEKPKISGEAALAIPVYEQLWFKKIVRLFAAAMVIIALIWALIRPVLRVLMYPDDIDEAPKP